MKSVGHDIVQYYTSAQSAETVSYILFTQAAKGWTIYLYFAVDSCVVISKEAPLVSQHSFFYPIQFLERYYSSTDLLNKRATHTLELCCESKEILHGYIKRSGALGPQAYMLLESSALSLLLCVLQKEQLKTNAICQLCSFSKNPADSSKIVEAQQLLIANMKMPLTIPQLAQKVGLNQCYLKRGFKELYGQTIYDYLQEQRMTQAKVLLSNANLNMSQIADMVGFSSANSFATAFKRIVGMQPSEWAKN